jgi:hypothetical protein
MPQEKLYLERVRRAAEGDGQHSWQEGRRAIVACVHNPGYRRFRASDAMGQEPQPSNQEGHPPRCGERAHPGAESFRAMLLVSLRP